MKTNKELLKILEKFKSKKILILGDLMLDKYVWGRVDRISPEAPVPVVLVEAETYAGGGAVNAAVNVAALSAKATIMGVVGNDLFKDILIKEMDEKNIAAEFIVDDSRPTILKERIMARNQQLLRKDYEKTKPYSEKIKKQLIDKFKSIASENDAVIISDYAKGINDFVIIREIISFCKKHSILALADFKSKDYLIYRGVSIITPNKHDSGKILNINPNTSEGIDKIGKIFVKELSCEVLITLGSKGMALFSQTGETCSIPPRKVEVYDVCGAGDTVSAASTVALASGAGFKDAAIIATHAAGVVIAKAGTATCSLEELKKSISQSQ